MKHFLLGVATLISFLQINAQSCPQFIKSINGDISTGGFNFNYQNQALGNMLFDDNNNMYLTGRATFFLTKYSNDGNIKWLKSKSGVLATDMEMYNSKHIYVISTGPTLCKFDTAGNELFAPVSIANFTPTGIAIDPSENVYVAGISPDPFSGSYYVNTIKFNSTGTAIWTKTLSTSCGLSFPSPDIVADNNNVYLSVTCVTSSTCTATMGTYTAGGPMSGMLVKIDPNGNCNWIKSITTGTAVQAGARIPMTLNNAGNIVIAGWDSIYVKNANGLNIQSKYIAGGHVLAIHNSKAAVIQLNMTTANFPKKHVVDLASTLPLSETVNHVSNGYTNLDYHLIGFDKLGNLYTAFSTYSPLGTRPSYVDLAQVTRTSSICYARYNQYDRLYPQYTSTTITCGDTVKFTGDVPDPLLSEGEIMGPTYQNATISWSPATGLSSSTVYSPKAFPTTSMVYTVTINGHCTSTVSVTNNNPTSFSYSTNSMVATFSINSTSCSSFIWDFGNGNTSSLNSNPVVTYATAGTYGVCLKCNGQAAACVKCINITVPSTSSGAIGMTELTNENSLLIYPNPNNGKFTIHVDEFVNNGSLKITNALGAIILADKFSGNEIEFDLSLASGIYFVHLEFDDKIVVRKITVQ